MTSPFGAVVQANAAFDKARYEKYAHASQPLSQTIINNSDYAWHLKQNVTSRSAIYLRNIDDDSDENDWMDYEPVPYFDKYEPLTHDGQLGLVIGNEPAFSETVVGKINLFLKEAIKRRVPVCAFAPPVGSTPTSWDGWGKPAYAEFAELMCAHPDLLCYDPHEYSLVLPTSGMITKDTQPGEVLYFTRALAKQEQWPKSLDVVTNCYHVGRVRHFFEYCKLRVRTNKPTVDLGEIGFEFVGDNEIMERWAKGLPVSQGGLNVAGYKTLEAYWRQEFPQFKSVQEANFEMTKWQWEVILQPMGVRSVRLFIVGDFKSENEPGKPPKKSKWYDTNYDTDPAMLDLFATYSIPGTPPPTPPPLPTFPADFDSRARKSLAHTVTMMVVRAFPSQITNMVAVLRDGDTVMVIPEELLKPSETVNQKIDGVEGVWLPLRVETTEQPVLGWVWAGTVKFEPIKDQQMETAIELLRLQNMLTHLRKDLELVPEFLSLMNRLSSDVDNCLDMVDKIVQNVQVKGIPK